MRVPEELDAIADGISISISAERFDLFDELDTFISLDDTGEMPGQAAAMPTFAATLTKLRRLVRSEDSARSACLG
jgi:hypothetical protein